MQWVNQLALFLGVNPNQIGRIGAGKTRPNGTLDVAMIQSLVRDGEVSAAVGDYGQVIVDEYQHVPLCRSNASWRRPARNSSSG